MFDYISDWSDYSLKNDSIIAKRMILLYFRGWSDYSSKNGSIIAKE